ncbi:MAG: precorrin-6A/cobalt-precorrin-6A reductase, partial [[Eubacterium] sulci]|nr:precorrin-6A/cobalt-precorrin-6A reductase [[Eubacterium] sulci]
MKICLFSGTSDGREMSKRLAEIGIDVSVYVATEYGGEEQGEAEGIEVSVGRKTEEEMRELMLKHDLCIDAT